MEASSPSLGQYVWHTSLVIKCLVGRFTASQTDRRHQSEPQRMALHSWLLGRFQLPGSVAISVPVKCPGCSAG
jgi:hypothetical protein